VPQPPPPGAPAENNIRTVVISINADHSMMINQDPIEEAALQNRLVDISRRAPNAWYSSKAIPIWSSVG